MALDLQILRTAKAALDEGLLNTADYDSMKASFIKAQSIKAGVEAGFISQTDYAEARAAFFSGLGMPVGGAVAAVAPSHSTPPQAPTSQGNGTTRSFKAPPPGQPQPSNTAIATAEPPASAPVKATRVPSQQPTEAVPSDRTIPPLSLPDPQTQAEACSTPTTDGSKSASLVPTPTGLSDRGGKNAAADKVCGSTLWTMALEVGSALCTWPVRAHPNCMVYQPRRLYAALRQACFPWRRTCMAILRAEHTINTVQATISCVCRSQWRASG